MIASARAQIENASETKRGSLSRVEVESPTPRLAANPCDKQPPTRSPPRCHLTAATQMSQPDEQSPRGAKHEDARRDLKSAPFKTKARDPRRRRRRARAQFILAVAKTRASKDKISLVRRAKSAGRQRRATKFYMPSRVGDNDDADEDARTVNKSLPHASSSLSSSLVAVARRYRSSSLMPASSRARARLARGSGGDGGGSPR